MTLFRKSNPTDIDPVALAREIDDGRERLNVFSESIRALFLFLREYTLDNHLRSLVDRNMVTRASFSLLMMDPDDFKQLNDTYGHTVGDWRLLAFAEKCRSAVRSDDFLTRYGGEEFTLILPGTSLRNATKKAKQLCCAIAVARYAADDSPTADGKNRVVAE